MDRDDPEGTSKNLDIFNNIQKFWVQFRMVVNEKNKFGSIHKKPIHLTQKWYYIIIVCIRQIWTTLEFIRRKLCTGRQPIVNRIVARKATDWSKFCKSVKQGIQLACIRCPNAQESSECFPVHLTMPLIFTDFPTGIRFQLGAVLEICKNSEGFTGVLEKNQCSWELPVVNYNCVTLFFALVLLANGVLCLIDCCGFCELSVRNDSVNWPRVGRRSYPQYLLM